MKPFEISIDTCDDIEIKNIGDLHFGDAFFSEDVLNSIIEWVRCAENRYIVITGDVFNAAICDSVSDTYSETMTVDEATGKFAAFIDAIGPDRILGVTSGNHDQRIWKSVGLDPVKFVCKSKGVNYSPEELFITVHLGHYSRDRGRVMYTIYATHGSGGGGTPGAKMNKLMKLRDIVVCDIYMMAHVHEPMVKNAKIYEFSSQGNSVVTKLQWFVISGSCLERGGYAAAKNYPPLCQQSPVLILSGSKKSIQARLEE